MPHHIAGTANNRMRFPLAFIIESCEHSRHSLSNFMQNKKALHNMQAFAYL